MASAGQCRQAAVEMGSGTLPRGLAPRLSTHEAQLILATMRLGSGNEQSNQYLDYKAFVRATVPRRWYIEAQLQAVCMLSKWAPTCFDPLPAWGSAQGQCL